MLTKTKLALAAALVLGAASAAQAGKDGPSDQTGGYRVGPLGQSLSGANPVYHRSLRARMMRGGSAFAFAPDGYAPTSRTIVREPTYMRIQDKFLRDSIGE